MGGWGCWQFRGGRGIVEIVHNRNVRRTRNYLVDIGLDRKQKRVWRYHRFCGEAENWILMRGWYRYKRRKMRQKLCNMSVRGPVGVLYHVQPACPSLVASAERVRRLLPSAQTSPSGFRVLCHPVTIFSTPMQLANSYIFYAHTTGATPNAPSGVGGRQLRELRCQAKVGANAERHRTRWRSGKLGGYPCLWTCFLTNCCESQPMGTEILNH
mmetsp:Transcript_10437/g.22410  ORF Transcript_10437/g.22410 Transcript_10437/m.22410 type:complete len:212 (-) Transcript_10437:375-1010(-)